MSQTDAPIRVLLVDDEETVRMSTAEMLLEMGERLVNNMNERSRRDLIDVAEREVQVAEARSKDAAASLASFRSGKAVFDPAVQGAMQLQGVLAKLRS